MEIKSKKKTLAGLFLKYAVLFCTNTVLIIAGSAVLLIACSYMGAVLPANYAEIQLAENAPKIQAAEEALERWIPGGCTYGIYDGEGKWKYGTFPQKEQESAWQQYERVNAYAGTGKFYRFIKQDGGDICIVKYELYMKYSWEPLNHVLPAPEVLSFLLDAAFFVLNALFLSRHFARKLNRQLGELREITDKIAGNDLEFQAKSSDIREIDEVFASLSHMRDALKDALKAQWDMEQHRKEQLSALAHDVKTPLTIIRGNAELAGEEEMSPENKECMDHILFNVRDIEKYLAHMQQVLKGGETKSAAQAVSCILLGEMFREMAVQLCAAEKIPVVFHIDLPEGEMVCSKENMLRAWNNILSNGAEHTDRKKGIEVGMEKRERESLEYMVVFVRDHGLGFTPRDLQYACQEFYSGDNSRHDRSHQGLGLAIAKRFLEEQGGFLAYQNHEMGGAEAELWIKLLFTGQECAYTAHSVRT